MVQEVLISHLTDNSVHFFEKAIQQFDDDPKLSTICFSTALELMLKARLAHEHWSLVVDKPAEAQMHKVKSGDFISAGPFEVMKRLTGIAGINFSDREKEAYKGLITKRNAIIHFSEELVTDDEKKKLISVAYSAVFHMERLMNGSWKELFIDKAEILRRISVVLKSFQPYLEEKFNSVKKELKKLEKEGASIVKCERCGFKSVVSEKEAESDLGILIEEDCHVCPHYNTYLIYDCFECGTPNKYYGYDDAENCSSCGVIISGDSISESNSPSYLDIYRTNYAFCPECEHHNPLVVPFGDDYICLYCFSIHEQIENCDYCNTPIAGYDVEGSYLEGCMMCEGRGYD